MANQSNDFIEWRKQIHIKETKKSDKLSDFYDFIPYLKAAFYAGFEKSSNIKIDNIIDSVLHQSFMNFTHKNRNGDGEKLLYHYFQYGKEQGEKLINNLKN